MSLPGSLRNACHEGVLRLASRETSGKSGNVWQVWKELGCALARLPDIWSLRRRVAMRVADSSKLVSPRQRRRRRAGA